jgi:hypothetical protein
MAAAFPRSDTFRFHSKGIYQTSGVSSSETWNFPSSEAAHHRVNKQSGLRCAVESTGRIRLLFGGLQGNQKSSYQMLVDNTHSRCVISCHYGILCFNSISLKLSGRFWCTLCFAQQVEKEAQNGTNYIMRKFVIEMFLEEAFQTVRVNSTKY